MLLPEIQASREPLCSTRCKCQGAGLLAQHFTIVVECTISNIRCIANSSIIWCNMVFNFVNNYT